MQIADQQGYAIDLLQELVQYNRRPGLVPLAWTISPDGSTITGTGQIDGWDVIARSVGEQEIVPTSGGFATARPVQVTSGIQLEFVRSHAHAHARSCQLDPVSAGTSVATLVPAFPTQPMKIEREPSNVRRLRLWP